MPERVASLGSNCLAASFCGFGVVSPAARLATSRLRLLPAGTAQEEFHEMGRISKNVPWLYGRHRGWSHGAEAFTCTRQAISFFASPSITQGRAVAMTEAY